MGAKRSTNQLVDELAREIQTHEKWFIASIYPTSTGWIQYAHLQPGFFTNDVCRQYWTALLKTGDTFKAAVEAGIVSELVDFTMKTPNLASPEPYYSKILKLHRALSVADHLQNAVGLFTTGNFDAGFEAIRKANENSYVSDTKGTDTADMHLAVATMLDQGSFPALSTGIGAVDNAIGKLKLGEISLLAARTSIGKTTFAWQVARSVARAGEKVNYFSTESDAAELWLKAACGLAGVDVRDVYMGNLPQGAKNAILDESAKLQNDLGSNLTVYDRPTLDDILTTMMTSGATLNVVDHLDELYRGGNEHSEFLAVGFTRLRDATKKVKAHTIVVHQLNRDPESRQDHRPTLADLRWSGDLEQKTDVAMFLHREDVYAPVGRNGVRRVDVELIVRKNRNGVRDNMAELVYDLLSQEFTQKNAPVSAQRPVSKVP